tara:strand:- start:4339 stop:4842 length:504 start_codon:yes stop_codon:yes gene_type:complete
MRYYESLYIVNPNFEQSRLDKAMKTVSDKVSEYGFKVINHFEWGKKRLAYNINEHKYGSYILLHFETESVDNLERYERFMVLQKSILRNQTVLLDKKPEVQSEKDLTSEEDKKNSTNDDSIKSSSKETEAEATAEEQTEEPAETEAEATAEEQTEEPAETEADKEEN